MIKSVITSILAAAIIILSIDATFSNLADYLTHLTTSSLGIILFVCFGAVFILLSVVLFRQIKTTSPELIRNSLKLRIAYPIAFGTQLSLIIVLIVILAEIIITSQYHSFMLILATGILSSSAAAVMVISALVLAGWHRADKHSYIVLIFGVAFAANVYICIYLGTTDISNLAEKSQIITPTSEVVYSSDSYQPWTLEDILWNIYGYTSTGIFLLFVAGAATMLHHYANKIGRVKFWALILLPLVYYSSTLVDTLGLYVPESGADFFYYYLYDSLNGVIGGALIGFAFWNIAKVMRANKSVSSYLQLCSYGFVFYSIAGVGLVNVASYPPFGFVSYSILTLSSYMIILGLYSTAVSISQDVRLRRYIMDLSKADSGFLNRIGQAQMEKQIQAKASDLASVVKEQRMELEKRSGIQSSVQEQDIKQYLLEVLQEVDKHKSTQ